MAVKDSKTTNANEGDKEPVQPPQGDDDTKGGADDAAGNDEEPLTFEDLDDKTKAFVNAETAKARKAAEAAAKRKAEAEAVKKAEEAVSEEAKKSNNFEVLYNKANEKVTALEFELAKSVMINRKIQAALKVGLPDPLNNYKRLVDSDDDEELETDAKTLKKSFGKDAYRDDTTPPTTPDGKGGKYNQEKTTKEKKQADDESYQAEFNLGIYRPM